MKQLTEVDALMMLTADNLNYLDVKASNFNESMIWGLAKNVIPQL